MAQRRKVGCIGVLVSVLQRNRSSRGVCVHAYIHVYTSCPFTYKVYSKEFVPMIMDSGKSQGEMKSWSPRRARGVVSDPERGSDSSLEAGKSRCPHFKVVRQEEFCFIWGRVILLFYSGLSLIV